MPALFTSTSIFLSPSARLIMSPAFGSVTSTPSMTLTPSAESSFEALRHAAMTSSPRALSCRQISSPIPRFAPVTTHVAMVHLLSREASIEDEVVERLYDDADDALSRDAARSDRDEVTLGPRLVHFGGDRREERAEEH